MLGRIKRCGVPAHAALELNKSNDPAGVGVNTGFALLSRVRDQGPDRCYQQLLGPLLSGPSLSLATNSYVRDSHAKAPTYKRIIIWRPNWRRNGKAWSREAASAMVADASVLVTWQFEFTECPSTAKITFAGGRAKAAFRQAYQYETVLRFCASDELIESLSN